jgi:hypothetical protein
LSEGLQQTELEDKIYQDKEQQEMKDVLIKQCISTEQFDWNTFEFSAFGLNCCGGFLLSIDHVRY